MPTGLVVLAFVVGPPALVVTLLGVAGWLKRRLDAAIARQVALANAIPRNGARSRRPWSRDLRGIHRGWRSPSGSHFTPPA